MNVATDVRWHGLYRLGGATALIIGVLLVAEIVVYALLPRSITVREHFALFRENWLAGLLTLDLLGLIAYLLFVPTILALYVLLRHTSEAIMAVGTAVFFLGVADFLATNTAFPVLSLSNQYAAAQTDADRLMFLAAGQALFTLFNENAFLLSYVIVSAAWLMISAAMLRGSYFSRITGFSGVLAGLAGMLAVVLEHAASTDALVTVAIWLYFAAIVFLFVWIVLTGVRLYRIGTNQEPDHLVVAARPWGLHG